MLVVYAYIKYIEMLIVRMFSETGKIKKPNWFENGLFENKSNKLYFVAVNTKNRTQVNLLTILSIKGKHIIDTGSNLQNKMAV